MKNQLAILTALLGFFFTTHASRLAAAPLEKSVASPNQAIVLTFTLADGSPWYSVNYHQRPVIQSSPLGFQLQDGPLNSNFILVKSTFASQNETWTQPWGESQKISNHYNELAVTLQQPGDSGRTLHIRFRVFDDAIAFRYEWPEQPNLKAFNITDELTEFDLTSDPLAIWQPAFRPQASEQLYARTRLSELLRQTHLPHGDSVAGDNPNQDPVRAVTTPLTMQTDDGVYLVIHEADLTDYAAMELQPKEGNILKCDLAP